MRLMVFRAVLSPTLALARAVGPAAAQATLPPGPGRAETPRTCGELPRQRLLSRIRRSQDAWATTIQNMINFGMTIGDADYDTVLAYLATWFGLAPRPHAIPPLRPSRARPRLPA